MIVFWQNDTNLEPFETIHYLEELLSLSAPSFLWGFSLKAEEIVPRRPLSSLLLKVLPLPLCHRQSANQSGWCPAGTGAVPPELWTCGAVEPVCRCLGTTLQPSLPQAANLTRCSFEHMDRKRDRWPCLPRSICLSLHDLTLPKSLVSLEFKKGRSLVYCVLNKEIGTPQCSDLNMISRSLQWWGRYHLVDEKITPIGAEDIILPCWSPHGGKITPEKRKILPGGLRSLKGCAHRATLWQEVTENWIRNHQKCITPSRTTRLFIVPRPV